MSREPVSAAAQHAEALGRGNVVVQIQGDGNTVVPGLAHLELTRHLHLRRSKEKQAKGISGLLSPYTYSIPFIGRDDVVADLWRWMERGDRPISIRVLVAPGGSGKTRLALELCDQATARGWAAGFVTDSELKRFFDKENLSTWGWSKPTLLVIDYAASKAQLLGKWLAELAGNASEVPLRLLLLERRADPSMEWWGEVFGRGGRQALEAQPLLDPEGGPYVLPRLPAEYRRRVFEATLQEVGASVPDSPQLDRRLSELSWGGEPLFLMMAALMSVQTSVRDVLALKPTDIAFRIAEDFELDRIRKIATSRGIAPDFLAHMAAYVTLWQGLSRSQAEEAIEVEKRMLRYDSVGDPPRIYQALHDALPGNGSDVSPVLPDILGEAVTLLGLGAGDPRKAEEAVLRAVASGGEKVLPVLIRVADDFGSIRKQAIDWLRNLVEEGREQEGFLIFFVDQIPKETLALRELAADLTAGLVDRLRRGGVTHLLASGLNNLSVRLSALGRREEALEAGQEAVFLYRTLMSEVPDDFRAGLGKSLINLVVQLSNMGRLNEALNIGQEAVALFRKLAFQHPEVFRPALAMALNSSASQLNASGRHKEALEAVQEAALLHLDLDFAHPGVFRSDLATSLNNLAIGLSDLGYLEEALEVGQKVVLLYQELASAHPGSFRPDLAMALNNLSNQLSALRHRQEALDAIQKAVYLFRELALERPEVFRPDLAMSLNNLALRLRAMERRQDALEAGQEAVIIRQELALTRPETFTPLLALSLFHLSLFLGDAGQNNRAVESCQEAVGLLIPYFLAFPAAFENRMVSMVDRYLYLVEEMKLQLDTDLLTPLVEAGFFEPETKDSTSPNKATSDPEEESR